MLPGRVLPPAGLLPVFGVILLLLRPPLLLLLLLLRLRLPLLCRRLVLVLLRLLLRCRLVVLQSLLRLLMLVLSLKLLTLRLLDLKLPVAPPAVFRTIRFSALRRWSHLVLSRLLRPVLLPFVCLMLVPLPLGPLLRLALSLGL